MTAIIGIQDAYSITLAGDFLCSSTEDGSSFMGVAKVVEGKDWAIGVAGSGRIQRLVEQTTKRNMLFTKESHVVTFCEVLEKKIKELDIYSPSSSDDFITYPFELIVASRHGLWEVGSDLVVYNIEHLCAIGAGKDLALGALQALTTNTNMDSISVAKEAIAIAGKYHIMVSPTSWVRAFIK